MRYPYEYDASRHKFVVTCDHTYYATVRYFETREEADAGANEMQAEDEADMLGSSSDLRPAIVVAEIVRAIELPEREASGL